MRGLMVGLIACCIAATISVITGFQTYYASYSPSGSVTTITYWHGYWRLLAVAYAAIAAIGFVAVYRRWQIAWRVGFFVLWFGAAWFTFHAWWLLWPQPYGWAGAAVATVVVPFILWWSLAGWRKQRSYFFPDEAEET